MTDKSNDDVSVTIIVSGIEFLTTKNILQAIPNSLLAELEYKSVTDEKGDDENIFKFDRDPAVFRYVLDAYKYGQLHTCRNICPYHFQRELEYWRVPLTMLSPCCWKTFYSIQEDMGIIQLIVERMRNRIKANRVGGVTISSQHFLNNYFSPQNKQAGGTTMRTMDTADNTTVDVRSIEETRDIMTADKSETRDAAGQNNNEKSNALWLFLEEPCSSVAAKMWCFFYLVMVLLSVVTVFTWSHPTFRVDPYLNPIDNVSYFDLNEEQREWYQEAYECSAHALLYLLSDTHKALFSLEIICLAFFILEAIVHFLSCPNKLRYFLCVENSIKVILCITMLLGMLGEVHREYFDNEYLLKTFLFIKSISVARLWLAFRLRKLYNALDILLLSLEKSLKELQLLVFVFFVCVTVYGTMLFCTEVNTATFENIFQALWWALITMTTVGYGDFYPKTTLGYLIGSVCALNGLIILALPVAAIASNFGTYYSINADICKHKEKIEEKHNGTKVCYDTTL